MLTTREDDLLRRIGLTLRWPGVSTRQCSNAMPVTLNTVIYLSAHGVTIEEVPSATIGGIQMHAIGIGYLLAAFLIIGGVGFLAGVAIIEGMKERSGCGVLLGLVFAALTWPILIAGLGALLGFWPL